jgi:hypothetical protein
MRSLGSFSPVRAIGGTMRLGAAFAVLGLALPAHAAVTISSSATSNMTCANGVCAPTASDAVLNVTDLENLLASADVEVTTTGSGVQAEDIVVKAALTWSASNALTLDAYRSVFVEKPVSVDGNGGVAVNFNTGDGSRDLYFGKKGNVTFADLSSGLTINGSSYTLENTVKGLAAAIADNPSGNFAFASSYNAEPDGTYTAIPIPTQFPGTFEGLGNQISKLRISSNGGGGGGLFRSLEQGSVIRDFALAAVHVKADSDAGGLASYSAGQILHCHVTGNIKGTQTPTGGEVGGLVGINDIGTIADSSSGATVSGAAKS